MYIDDLISYMMAELFATPQERKLDSIRDAPEFEVSKEGVDSSVIETIIHPILVDRGFKRYKLYAVSSDEKRLYGRILPDGRTQFLSVDCSNHWFNPNKHLDSLTANAAPIEYIQGPSWGVSPHQL